MNPNICLCLLVGGLLILYLECRRSKEPYLLPAARQAARRLPSALKRSRPMKRSELKTRLRPWRGGRNQDPSVLRSGGEIEMIGWGGAAGHRGWMLPTSKDREESEKNKGAREIVINKAKTWVQSKEIDELYDFIGVERGGSIEKVDEALTKAEYSWLQPEALQDDSSQLYRLKFTFAAKRLMDPAVQAQIERAERDPGFFSWW